MAQEQPVENLQHIFRTHAGPNFHCKRLAGVFIQNREHLVAPPIAQLVVNEIDAPDMVGMRRSEPNDRTVLVVQATLLLVPLRELQTFLPPQPFYLLVIDTPALNPKQLRHLTVAIPAIALGQTDHGQSKSIIVLLYGLVLHGAACKSDHLAGATL